MPEYFGQPADADDQKQVSGYFGEPSDSTLVSEPRSEVTLQTRSEFEFVKEELPWYYSPNKKVKTVKRKRKVKKYDDDDEDLGIWSFLSPKYPPGGP